MLASSETDFTVQSADILNTHPRPVADLLAEIGQPPPEKTKDSQAGVSKYKQVFRLRVVHLMAFFIFTYVGVEVTIGGACFMRSQPLERSGCAPTASLACRMDRHVCP